MSTFLDSSEFTTCRKLCYAIKLNFLIYSIGLGALILYMLYFIFTGDMKIDLEEFLAVLMSLASAWALTQIIVFLSNGLIAVPRMLFRKGDTERRLKMICCRLVQVTEIIDDDRFAIAKYLKKAHMIEMLASTKNKRRIEEIYKLVPEDVASFELMSTSVNADEAIEKIKNPSYSTIVKLHYKITTNLHELSIHSKYTYTLLLISQQKRLIKEGLFIEDVIKSQKAGLNYLLTGNSSRREGKCGAFLDKLCTFNIY